MVSKAFAAAEITCSRGVEPGALSRSLSATSRGELTQGPVWLQYAQVAGPTGTTQLSTSPWKGWARTTVQLLGRTPLLPLILLSIGLLFYFSTLCTAWHHQTQMQLALHLGVVCHCGDGKQEQALWTPA